MITKKLEQERYRYTRHVRSELHERINHVVQRSRDLPSLYPDVTIANTTLLSGMPAWIDSRSYSKERMVNDHHPVSTSATNGS